MECCSGTERSLARSRVARGLLCGCEETYRCRSRRFRAAGPSQSELTELGTVCAGGGRAGPRVREAAGVRRARKDTDRPRDREREREGRHLSKSKRRRGRERRKKTEREEKRRRGKEEEEKREHAPPPPPSGLPCVSRPSVCSDERSRRRANRAVCLALRHAVRRQAGRRRRSLAVRFSSAIYHPGTVSCRTLR